MAVDSLRQFLEMFETESFSRVLQICGLEVQLSFMIIFLRSEYLLIKYRHNHKSILKRKGNKHILLNYSVCLFDQNLTVFRMRDHIQRYAMWP